jgi:predicted alpha-1,2-mannosidase
MIRFSFFLSLILILTCCSDNSVPPAKKDKDLSSYVNTFIGTGGHGHTYPGATMPFGMMQLSPDTRLEGWDGCSGYHYSDEYIYGFSHTHLSGTGISDYGDILLMPTNEVNFNNGSDGKNGYRAHFSHENEEASPGYYKVRLDSTEIDVELTVSQRAGIHKYVFPSSENQVVILDLKHRDMLLGFNINQISDYEINGYRHSKAWAQDQRLFYHIKFSHPFKTQIPPDQKLDENPAQMAFIFDNPNNDPIIVSVGISAVDEGGAFKNLREEIGSDDFSRIKNRANRMWENQLSKIIIESPNDEYKTTFYSALYHTMLAPNLYHDVDKRYRGIDMKIHQNKNFDYYTVFSLWDTYRAAHPLYTIIEQERTRDFINTFLAKYDEGGIMPIWDLSANYTGCMIGYHGVSVIADAYLKGIDGYDTEKAFQAMKHSAMQNHLGMRSYKEFGFIPMEEESESVSKTLEYAYDDWTIAVMAEKMGHTSDAQLFYDRAQNFKNIFDPESGFMRGRFRNTWFSPFDPYEVNFNYTEANAWQYSLYVPQDISGLMDFMGGKQDLEQHLDNLFTAETKTSGRDQADITGLIGQYAHGNEPSHHMAYLYNFVNKPHKTQEKVYQILTELYKNEPDGISGNEDCGQMSAWYVFSSLGFYPVTPGSNQYIIGTPLFEKATINLENGEHFTVVARDISSNNKYIEYATLNGEALNKSYLMHDEIISGGTLQFQMTDQPSAWGTKNGEEPKTEIIESSIVMPPFITQGEIAFKDETQIALAVSSKESTIYYNLNGSSYSEYLEPIFINERTLLSTYSEKDGGKSKVLHTQFYKIDPMLSIKLENNYANQYSAGGDNALIDGIRGSSDFRTGAWQGYQDTDVVAIVDLGRIRPIDSISVNFLQDQGSWIFYPTEVECYIAPGKTFYKNLPPQKIDATKPSNDSEIKTLHFEMSGYSARYIKIVAKNLGDLPKWHLGSQVNGKAWIFVDEIEIK